MINIQTYLRQRRPIEVMLWSCLFLGNWAVNTSISFLDAQRANTSFFLWEHAIWEGTSILLIAILLPWLIKFDRYFTLLPGKIPSHLGIHLIATVPFSLIHVLGMVGLREVVYTLAGLHYDFGSWQKELTYEYLKDFRTYFSLLLAIYLYRFFLLRLQGEARFLQDEESNEPSVSVAVPEHILVKKLGREFLIRTADIEWIQAAGNYVNLHLEQRIYPLRETMTGITKRLRADQFARVQRSYIVNIDQIKEIELFDSGDARITLQRGMCIPLSRRYRRDLQRRFNL